MGYSMLFQIVDAILRTYGFDTYCGVLHTDFYMRKSLVCDLIEPMRPIIDLQIRKSINLGQCKEEDFEVYNYKYQLPWKNSPKYVAFLMEAIIDRKDEIFLYVQQYYRAFMRNKPYNEFPKFEVQV